VDSGPLGTADDPTPADGPLQENASWPTTNNVTEELATNLCENAIKENVENTVFRDCLQYTTSEMMTNIKDCIKDIQVTSLNLVFVYFFKFELICLILILRN